MLIIFLKVKSNETAVEVDVGVNAEVGVAAGRAEAVLDFFVVGEGAFRLRESQSKVYLVSPWAYFIIFDRVFPRSYKALRRYRGQPWTPILDHAIGNLILLRPQPNFINRAPAKQRLLLV